MEKTTNLKPKSFPDEMIERFGSLEKAIDWTKENVAKSPLDHRLNLQVLLNLVGREEESFEISNQLMMIAPDDSRVLFNRGWHLIHRNQFKEGFGLLEHGRIFGSYGDKKPMSGVPWFNLNTPVAKHIILNLEGGLGDQIIQARFADNIARHAGHPITVACDASLASIISRMPSVHTVVTSKAKEQVYHEQWLPGMSAPSVLLNSFDQISGKPYLTTFPAAAKHWKKVISQFNSKKKLKVGIRWAGSPEFEHQQMRKFPPEILTDLANLKLNSQSPMGQPQVTNSAANENDSAIQLFSFQRDNDLLDLPESIVDLGPFLKSWEDTAAALKEMDLVISSCTSVAHMSAALGVPTWVISPVLPYFVWALPGDKSPWYDCVTLYRQTIFGRWDDVAEKIRNDLESTLSQSEASNRRPWAMTSDQFVAGESFF